MNVRRAFTNALGSPGPYLILGLIATRLQAGITLDEPHKLVTIADEQQNLVLRLSYDQRCVLDRVTVRSREVVAPGGLVFSGIKAAGAWATTRAGQDPHVAVSGNVVTVSGLHLHAGDVELQERWVFTTEAERIRWRIERTYGSGGTLEDMCLPGWDFADLATWTGALLGHGGVAWVKLLDKPNASYGVHSGPVTFWNKAHGDGLRMVPTAEGRRYVAVRFTRQPDNRLSCYYAFAADALAPKYQLRRFLPDKQDVWAPFGVAPVKVAVEFTLSGLDYNRDYDRGTFPYFDGAAIREISTTIARIGAIDAQVHGSNGWYSGYAVLQEHWLAQLGLLIDDPAYFQGYAATLDYQREHAIGPDGRVKSRWAYGSWDAMPGTYDANGFYETQWGYMFDSQTGWVINVAEQFDFTGDLDWLRGHKGRCERVLDYLQGRDTDGNGLVEMLSDSRTAAKGSDWIDVVWASYENALINAELYYALTLWADAEGLLGDTGRAERCRAWAGRLKESFNRPVAEGGFWNPANQWYVHWRDRDGSLHGDNLVTPVNFMAVAYGLCDDPSRQAVILDRIEAEMQKEKLFFWPLCLFSYRQDEVHEVNWPFPKYENGDIFLGWGEVGARAYAHYKPAIAVRCIKNVLDQYAKDGLAFQRYLRGSQQGAGDDILANNCNPVVGLYRDIYGLQPKYNRLYLEPHLTPELDGTQLKYWLRNQAYVIDLRMNDYGVTVADFTVQDRKPFGISAAGNTLHYFPGDRRTPELVLMRADHKPLTVGVSDWSGTRRQWRESGAAVETGVRHRLAGLKPNTLYHWSAGNQAGGALRSDAAGALEFSSPAAAAQGQVLEVGE